MEVIDDGGSRLSVVLAGHPKLRNDLRRPIMEEIGYRTSSFVLDDLEPRLTRHGYSVPALSDPFNAEPAETRRLLRGELDAARTREVAGEMRAAGLPL